MKKFFCSWMVFLALSAQHNASAFETQVAANAVNEFAIDLYGHLRTPDRNLFFSPYSVSQCLAMTCAGARGATRSQIAETLHFSPEEAKINRALCHLSTQVRKAGNSESIKINIGNGLWGDEALDVKEDYLQSVRDSYLGVIRKVDFLHQPEAARETINTWVEEQTDRRIVDLLPEGAINAVTRLVLANAICFRGMWEFGFEKRFTQEAPFLSSTGKSIRTWMMNCTAPFGYLEEEGVKVIELPYKGGELTMVVLLPPENRSFEDFEKRLTAARLSYWISHLKSEMVDTYLPRFTIASSHDLKTSLIKMGMTNAFSPSKADFSGMIGNANVWIQGAIHKAYLNVNEDGTEAAAATGVVERDLGIMPPAKLFRADHPFVFLIRHTRSNSILFIGRVISP